MERESTDYGDSLLDFVNFFWTGLQGHAIKNQDILVASGAVRLRGSEGISALEEDVQFVSPAHLPFPYLSNLPAIPLVAVTVAIPPHRRQHQHYPTHARNHRNRQIHRPTRRII